jgi:hypothetical protein
MTVKEQVVQTLDTLNEAELEQVAEYLAFLKLRAHLPAVSPLDTGRMAELYAEFADEDRLLAEQGIDGYGEGLLAEDTQ